MVACLTPTCRTELSAKYGVSHDTIAKMVAAFEAELKGKSREVNNKVFVNVVARLRDATPEMVAFDDDVANLVFTYCDVNHNNRVDAYELIAALSTFCGGSVEDKARLVFQVVDRDKSNTLTKSEVHKHAQKVLTFSKNLVKEDVRKKLAEEDMPKSLGNLAAWSMGKAMEVLEKKFVDDIVRDVFRGDENHDGLISLEEWLASSKTNTTVQALMDPVTSASVWRVLFSDADAGDQELVERTQTDPRGLCLLFDVAFGRGFALARTAPAQPFTLHVSVAGGPDFQQRFEADSKWAQLVAFAAASTGIAKDSLDLYKQDERVHALDDSEELRSLKLVDGDVLTAADYKAPWEGNLTIKTLTGKSIVLENVSNAMLVSDIKAKVQDKEGIPVDQQRLVLAGKQLDDEHTLTHYHVRQGATVHLILRLRAD